MHSGFRQIRWDEGDLEDRAFTGDHRDARSFLFPDLDIMTNIEDDRSDKNRETGRETDRIVTYFANIYKRVSHLGRHRNPDAGNGRIYGKDPESLMACRTIMAIVTITIAAIQRPGWLIADSDRRLVTTG